MSERRGVPAAEKYAELLANGQERPLCACHGKPKVWSKRESQSGGGWKCSRRFNNSVKGVEACRRYRESAHGRKRQAETRRRYYLNHREEEFARMRLYVREHPKVRLFGHIFYAPDQQFREYAVQLREERRRALKEASNG